MRYEWKARLFIGLVFLLIGITFGWLSGAAGYSKLWFLGMDALFLVIVGNFIFTTYFKTDKTGQRGGRKNDREKDNPGNTH